MVLRGIREEPVQGLPHMVGRLGRPTIAIRPGRKKPADHLRRDVFQVLGGHVVARIGIDRGLGLA
jgi:hypothetical protein